MAAASTKRIDTIFSRIYILGLTWLILGAHLDQWSHVNQPESLETFFTWWHLVLYTGFMAAFITLLAWIFCRRKRGLSWKKAVPPGFMVAVIGGTMFFFAGFGDMTWHLVFGIESDIEALLSPTHLMLAFGAGMLSCGSICYYWKTTSPTTMPTLTGAMPLILPLTYATLMLFYMTSYGVFTRPVTTIVAVMQNLSGQLTAHTGLKPAAIEPEAFVRPYEEPGFYEDGLGILGVIFFSIVVVAALSIAIKHSKLPFGTVTVFLGTIVTTISLTMQLGQVMIPSAFLAGVLCDIILQRAQEHPSLRTYRCFCFLLPAIYYTFVFVSLKYLELMPWSVHMWTGAPVVAGIAGYLAGIAIWQSPSKLLS